MTEFFCFCSSCSRVALHAAVRHLEGSDREDSDPEVPRPLFRQSRAGLGPEDLDQEALHPEDLGREVLHPEDLDQEVLDQLFR